MSRVLEAGFGGTDGIRVYLAAHMVRDGFGFVDRCYNVARIISTALRAVVFGNAADNTRDGGAGNDLMYFGLGNDTGHGGCGADAFTFDAACSDATIKDVNAAGGDKIRVSVATSFHQITFAGLLIEAGLAALVTFGNTSVTPVGVQAGDLHDADVVF